VLAWEAAQKIFEIGGVFLGCVGETVFSPRLPRIPPRLHQQKNTATKVDFSKHPQKHPQNCETPARPRPHNFLPQEHFP
jgi:hypothetical protein